SWVLQRQDMFTHEPSYSPIQRPRIDITVTEEACQTLGCSACAGPRRPVNSNDNTGTLLLSHPIYHFPCLASQLTLRAPWLYAVLASCACTARASCASHAICAANSATEANLRSSRIRCRNSTHTVAPYNCTSTSNRCASTLRA